MSSTGEDLSAQRSNPYSSLSCRIVIRMTIKSELRRTRQRFAPCHGIQHRHQKGALGRMLLRLKLRARNLTNYRQWLRMYFRLCHARTFRWGFCFLPGRGESRSCTCAAACFTIWLMKIRWKFRNALAVARVRVLCIVINMGGTLRKTPLILRVLHPD